jgi:glycosyltransferase involved in cell wall biosynthesis
MRAIVIPTSKRATTLLLALRSLLTQASDERYEVIIVDNDGGHDTQTVADSVLGTRAPHLVVSGGAASG